MFNRDLVNLNIINTPNKKERLKAFLIAPAIPIILIAIFTLPFGLFFLLFGLPLAYIGAFFIGVPLYILLKKIGLLSLPFVMLGGVICAAPGIIIFWKPDLQLIYSLGNLTYFSMIGMSGGLAFWFLYIRNKNQSIQKPITFIGFALVLMLGCFLAYISHMAKYDFIDAKTPSSELVFLSSNDRIVDIQLNDKVVKAQLRRNVPFIKECEIYAVVWKELWTHKTRYSVSTYKDYPRAHMYNHLNEDTKSNFPQSCN